MHPAIGRLLVALPSFALGAGVALLISAWSSDATRASEATQMQARLSEARLAVEEAELIALFRDKLPAWQVPDRVIFVDELPLGATGKVLKAKLRAEYGDCLLATAG